MKYKYQFNFGMFDRGFDMISMFVRANSLLSLKDIELNINLMMKNKNSFKYKSNK
jgi:hypothetical protein